VSEPFLGQISSFAFAFAPKGWGMANGQILPINQNQALFALLGTQYGGNGIQTFALPNLQGRVAVHNGGAFVIGHRPAERRLSTPNNRAAALPYAHGGLQ